jgi:hypothetical protein
VGGEHKFRSAATNVPRQCPFVLLVEVGLVKVRRLEVESGTRREVEQGLTAFVHNFEFCY